MAKAFLKGELEKEFRNLEHLNVKPSKNKQAIIEPKSTSCHGVKKAIKRSQSKHLNAKSTTPFIRQTNFRRKYSQIQCRGRGIKVLSQMWEIIVIYIFLFQKKI